MSVPALRFAEFEGEWQRKTLEDLNVEISDGNYGEMYPTAEQFVQYGVPFIRANNLRNATVRWTDMRFITPELHDLLRSGHLQAHDILVTTRGEIGLVSMVPFEFVGANINAQICLLRNVEGGDQHFIFNYLTHASAKRQFVELTTGSALKQLPRKNLRKIQIGFPSLPEQKKIAAFLGVVDDKLAALRARKAGLETYKRGLMQNLFSRTLRFTKPDGSAFPDWDEKRLRDVVSINPKSKNLPDTFAYIDLEAVNDGILGEYETIDQSTAPSRAQRFLKMDDVLFQLVRPYQRNNLWFNEAGDFVASTGYAQIRALENIGFIYQLLHEDKFVNKVIERCTGTSYPAINSNDLALIPIEIPHPEEQTLIANALQAMDTKITAVQTQITQMEAFKKGLLQQMFV